MIHQPRSRLEELARPRRHLHLQGREISWAGGRRPGALNWQAAGILMRILFIRLLLEREPGPGWYLETPLSVQGVPLLAWQAVVTSGERPLKSSVGLRNGKHKWTCIVMCLHLYLFKRLLNSPGLPGRAPTEPPRKVTVLFVEFDYLFEKGYPTQRAMFDKRYRS